MKKVAAFFAVLMVMLVPLSGAVAAEDVQEQKNSMNSVIWQAKLWYYLYIGSESKLQELHEKSVSAGVDDAVIQKAMELYENASAEYETAMSYGNPLQSKTMAWLPFIVHMRQAVITLRDAVSLLENALTEAQSA
ncbi:hypothetical protein TEU_09410 [Thermococcus eurythermalis]|uniref:Pyrolysin n=2 Tax=Thermococcus eurythermalis TaxID=1505907 RepID=A0A097QVN3_9EURY|nr:hypothetical protein TEU_09410 [Thermococcus eurythermalis]